MDGGHYNACVLDIRFSYGGDAEEECNMRLCHAMAVYFGTLVGLASTVQQQPATGPSSSRVENMLKVWTILQGACYNKMLASRHISSQSVNSQVIHPLWQRQTRAIPQGDSTPQGNSKAQGQIPSITAVLGRCMPGMNWCRCAAL